jgi:hypothetical protein
MKKWFDRDDFLILLGGIAIFYGLFRISPSAAIIVAGAFACFVGYSPGRKGGDN